MKPSCFLNQTFTIPVLHAPEVSPFDDATLPSFGSFSDSFLPKSTDEPSPLFNAMDQFSLFPSSFELDHLLEDSFVEKMSPTPLMASKLNSSSETEIQQWIASSYRDHTISTEFPENTCLFLRWTQGPPERVHATSPAKLTASYRAGGTFTISVELVGITTDGYFSPYPSPHDITVVAHACGKRKNRSSGKYDKSIIPSSNEVTVLETNPVGKPLLIVESSPSPMVKVLMKAGTSSISIQGLSLTCGSNAARAKNAPLAAKGWDWDYFLQVKAETKIRSLIIPPLISRHITTDSNRSQTREKREKRKYEEFEQNQIFPPPKRAAVSTLNQYYPIPSVSSDYTIPTPAEPVHPLQVPFPSVFGLSQFAPHFTKV